MKDHRVALASGSILLAVLALAGCNNAKLKAIAAKAQATAAKSAESIQKKATEQISSASTDVQEQLQLAGKINLELDEPLEAKACYARFVSQGSGRPTVFELRSYSSPDKEMPPSVFYHAQIRATSAAELSGQVVSGRLFIQTRPDGPVWYSPTGSPVEVKITSIEEKTLTAEIVSASLQNTQTGASINATGSFHAVQQ